MTVLIPRASQYLRETRYVNLASQSSHSVWWGVDPLRPTWQKYMESVGKEMSYIKTYDQETYEVKVDRDSIKARA